MFNLWGKLTDDIDWDSVTNNVGTITKRLSDAARENLVVVSAICAMSGGIFAGASLVGSYATRVSFCHPKTNPCTQVEMDVNADRPPNVEVQYIPGLGLQRTASAVLSVLLFAGGLATITKAQEEQEKIEPEIQLQQQIRIKQLELEANTELVNLETLAQTRIEVHEQELKEVQAELFFERNPHMVEQYLPKPEAPPVAEAETPEKSVEHEEESHSQKEPADSLFFGVKLPENPDLAIEFWDWEWFNVRADDMPHIRIIAPTNGGKTTLCDWLADVVPFSERQVITVKRKPHQWVGIPVHGVPFNYLAVRDQLEGLQSEMVERTRLMEKGEYRGKLTAIVDEWKAIARNVKALKDEEGKQIVSPSAKEIMGDLLTLARESGIKIFALAQGRQVITWGLEGESDILDCFATVYLGSFAVEEAQGVQTKYAKNSDEFATWDKVVDFLKTQGKRAAWVETEFGKYPAIAPDLSEWKREVSKLEKTGVESQQKVERSDLKSDRQESHDSDIKTEAHSPFPIPHSPFPIPHSHDPDDLLRQNLDLILKGLERSLVQSTPAVGEGNLGVNHPEVEVVESQAEPVDVMSKPQVPQEAATVSPPQRRYTPMLLVKTEIIATVGKMRSEGVSETKIIEQLWQVKKSAAGWSRAYREYKKELGL